MSIRIHELAKKIGMDNKSMLALLKERKFEVKSVSSTIDNISAEALQEEFAKPAEPEAPVAEVAAVAVKPAPAPPPAPGTPPKVNIPAGVFVKSSADIVREKAEKVAAIAAEKAAAAAAANPAAAPVPVAAAPTPPPAPAAPVRAASPAPVVVPPVSRPAASPIPPPAAPRPAATPPTPSTPTTPGKGPALPSTAEAPAAAAPVVAVEGEIQTVQIKPPIIVREFAVVLGLKPFKLISELMAQGIFASMNQTIEEDVAMALGEKHNVILEIKHRGEKEIVETKSKEDLEVEKEINDAEEEERNLSPRPPVVCILGHVDHGKTSLLDTIRKANVVSGEAGGITQHIGAYQVKQNKGLITFLDTPGHAAFNKMRARGAQVTDVAILVIAADDGFKPQTLEALKFIKDAGVTLIVAVNKMDAPGANLDQVKTQMQQHDIASEDWGGTTITVPVSALKGDGIDDLLEMINLQAEVLELKANAQTDASGIIIESQLEVGRGPLATVIVQRGTLKVGDAIVCGKEWAKVRAMFDDQGKNIKSAPPSTPVRVIGWSGPPESGATFKAVKNSRMAQELAEDAADIAKKTVSTKAAEPKEVSVEALFANIARTQAKNLKLVIKSDVYGSSEAVRGMIEGIQSEKVSSEIVANEVGLITKTDVQRASAAGATILAFNTKLENGVIPMAKHHGVGIESFKIIYELSDRVREMMADLLDPDSKEVKKGAAEVREVFPLAKGFVAGCLVTEGKIIRNASARIHRGKESVYEGKVNTLKRFKDDANEIRAGLECGIQIDDFNGYEKGDVIEIFEIQEVRASL
ncbi:MAG: translation initiation factor IF-2 [Opitutaceae bacterium]|tara:strand:+ start:8125 stop:10548 length:2424 start_codon:yes stop_codon:yes gene_type:complete